MGKIFTVVIAGVALFLGAAWYSGLLTAINTGTGPDDDMREQKRAAEDLVNLGPDLYDAAKFPKIEAVLRRSAEPTVLQGVLNPKDQEEVPSLVNGKVLFIGEQVDESAVLAAGSAAFLAEPYYFATVYTGRQSFVKFYRRLYEGDTISQNQMLAMIEPAEALGEVLGKMAKIANAKAEHEAAVSGEAEGLERYQRAIRLNRVDALGKEELGSARLTFEKLHSEQRSKYQSIIMAEIEKDQADIKLHMHEIRAVLPFKHSIIKTIVRQRGYAVKQLDPIIVVQNLEELMAEAQIEEQYFTDLRARKHVTATIEPMILEKPLAEFPGHALDVTCVAVARDMRIVSGSDDRTVCVWTTNQLAPVRKFELDEAVKVVACAPKSAAQNICLAGCTDGSIYLWDLDDKANTPTKRIEKAHGNDVAITSVAWSPDGKSFASGASDGSIRIWFADGSPRYAFVPENGVAHGHDDAVTSLTFTPQCRLVSASRDKTLRVWLLKEKGAGPDGKAVKNRDGNVANLGVSHDGKWMLFDQLQGRTLKLLSVETHTLTHTINAPANSTPFDTFAIFSPDSSLILTAGAPEGRMQLWRTPNGDPRAFEVRQFATRERLPVTCAAFSPDAGKPNANSFAVSAAGQKIYLWRIPTPEQVNEHRVEKVRMTLKTQTLDPSVRTTRVGFEVHNPDGRFEAGRPVTIVID